MVPMRELAGIRLADPGADFIPPGSTSLVFLKECVERGDVFPEEFFEIGESRVPFKRPETARRSEPARGSEEVASLVTVSNVEDVVTEEVPQMPDAREEAGSIVLPDVPERTRSRSPRRGRPARAVWTEEET